jgi:hypothetical protein
MKYYILVILIILSSCTGSMEKGRYKNNNIYTEKKSDDAFLKTQDFLKKEKLKYSLRGHK